MSTSVYRINKGIGKPIEFRGLKAQYIWYLGGGLLVLLVLFAVLYICGVNPFVCLGLVAVLGTWLFWYVYRLSHKYGEYGMMKRVARRRVPRVVKVRSRGIFLRLRKKGEIIRLPLSGSGLENTTKYLAQLFFTSKVQRVTLLFRRLML